MWNDRSYRDVEVVANSRACWIRRRPPCDRPSSPTYERREREDVDVRKAIKLSDGFDLGGLDSPSNLRAPRCKTTTGTQDIGQDRAHFNSTRRPFEQTQQEDGGVVCSSASPWLVCGYGAERWVENDRRPRRQVRVPTVSDRDSREHLDDPGPGQPHLSSGSLRGEEGESDASRVDETWLEIVAGKMATPVGERLPRRVLDW